MFPQHIQFGVPKVLTFAAFSNKKLTFLLYLLKHFALSHQVIYTGD